MNVVRVHKSSLGSNYDKIYVVIKSDIIVARNNDLGVENMSVIKYSSTVYEVLHDDNTLLILNELDVKTLKV